MSSNSSFILEPAGKTAVPIIISIPHVGTEIPEPYRSRFDASLIEKPTDTDWFVDRLYSFANDMGITILKSRYSRYLVDLNRGINREKLYDDGRQETGLVSNKSFDGSDLYKPGLEPTDKEISERIKLFHQPYHQALNDEIANMKKRWDNVLLFEAHSIRRHVPLLNPNPFPDLIIGDQNGNTCSKKISNQFISDLNNSDYTCSHNKPFMGGYNTRLWGRPSEGIHSIQLEISQEIYMDESNYSYTPDKADPLYKLLEKSLGNLAEVVKNL